MRTLSRQELVDILHGAAILGTGGGGELEEGLALIDEALALGKEFVLVQLDEAPEDGLLCTPYMLGAISEAPAEERRQYERLPRLGEQPILLAYRRFQEYLRRPFYGTVCCELGGSNTAVAFYAAAMSGHVIVDADPAGRAVPEVTHSSYYLHGLPVSPIVMANEFGEVFVAEHVLDDLRAEGVVRALSVASGNDIAAIDHALPVSRVKPAVIPGTITTALKLGQVWRAARDQGQDVAEVVATTGSGVVAFRGTVGPSTWRTEGGFTLGTINIVGSTAAFLGDEYKIQVKNENLVGWKNGEVQATIPDLICVLDTDTGMPVTNPNYYQGQHVAVVLLPSPAIFTTAKGLAAFGPRYAGLANEEYQPFTTKYPKCTSLQ
mmetsp:Transcript_3460/g.12476  ORF Transcript_3460/g.12476 Transcript_3460/m.12476 type:complete len:378 (-) Transcript_3460:40-1173(-)